MYGMYPFTMPIISSRCTYLRPSGYNAVSSTALLSPFVNISWLDLQKVILLRYSWELLTVLYPLLELSFMLPVVS